MAETPRGGSVPSKIRTGGGNGGYSRKSGISHNPRTPKPLLANHVRNPAVKRSADGTRMNAGNKR